MRLISFFAIIGILSACSSSDNPESGQKRFGNPDYSLGQCQNSPFEGEEIGGGVTQGSAVPLRLFEKKFYLEGLEKTLNASSYTIAQAIHSEGVEVLRVKSRENQDLPCRYFDFLNQADGVAQKNWDDVAQPASTKGSLLGLFTTVYSKNTQNKKTSLKNPTIMVLDQTQKWTLLHEMSHYLFARARTLETNLIFNNDIETQIREKAEEIKQIREFLNQGPNGAEALRLANAYDIIFDLNLELDRRTALEEFSIEALLIDYAKNGRINHIDLKQDHQQAYAYMKSNGDQVAFSYITFLDRLREVQQYFKDNFYDDAFIEMEKLIGKVQNQVDFIDRELQISALTHPEQPTLKELAENQPFEFHRQAEHLNAELDAFHHFDFEKFKKRHELLRNL